MAKTDFYVVTDTHYFEVSLGASGKAYDEHMKSQQKGMRENQGAVRATFDAIAADRDISTVIIAGDLTQNGEYESHVSLVRDLKKLKESGKRILLIYALHDWTEKPSAYAGDERITVKGTKKEELWPWYDEFGYDEAIARDEETHSYVAQLGEGLRLLAINCDGDKQGVHGIIYDRQLEWIAQQAEEAERCGDRLIAMEHYPLVPQQPVFGIIGDCVLKDWKNRAAFLADHGIHLIFTGHMHAQSVKRFTGEKGNSIIDVQTSAVCGYPAAYRKVSVDGDNVEIKSLDVPVFTLEDGTVVDKKYFEELFSVMIPNKLGSMLKDGKPEQTAVQRLLLKAARSLTVGGLLRMVFAGADRELKKMKVTDFAVKVVLPLFGGDPQFTPDTAVYRDSEKLFRRLSPVMKKVNAKLSKNGETVDVKELFLSSLYNSDGLSDNDVSFKI